MGWHIGGGVGPVRYSKRLGAGRRSTSKSTPEETASTIRFLVYYVPAFLVCWLIFAVGGASGAAWLYALFVAIPGAFFLMIVAAIVRAVKR
ncbi:MAG: hypothetical protein J2P22_04110 [Nocardioides sp.]|nr:hypothetical protein [Nocardioides sp.]